MLISLALLLCQEPALRWSREVDDQFWQALHLLEVEERAEDAAATLASLIEEPSVQQYRGQTGYLLAQQYRALRAAGRHDEAQALLPSIRRDVAGTEMAGPTEGVLDLADSTYGEQSAADEQLIEILVNATPDADYLRSMMRGYGERAVPELLAILDQPSEHYPANVVTQRVHTLWHECWNLSSESLFQGIASRVQLRGWEYLKMLVTAARHQPELREAQRDFLLRLSLHPDVRVLEFAVARLAPFVHDEELIEDRVRSLIESDSEYSPLTLRHMFRLAGSAKTGVALSPVIQDAIESERTSLSTSARAMAIEFRHPQALRYLADEKDDLEARHLLLRGFKPRSIIGGRVEARQIDNRAIDIAWNERMEPIIGTDGLAPMIAERGTEAGLEWTNWFEDQGRVDEPLQREYVFSSAVWRGDMQVALNMLERGEAPEGWPLYLNQSDVRRNPELHPHLLQAINSEESEERAWLLIGPRREAFERISAEQFLELRRRLGVTEVNAMIASHADTQSPEGLVIAKERCLDLARSTELEDEERTMLLASYLRYSEGVTSKRDVLIQASESLASIPHWFRFRGASSLVAALEDLATIAGREDGANHALSYVIPFRIEFELMKLTQSSGQPTHIPWIQFYADALEDLELEPIFLAVLNHNEFVYALIEEQDVDRVLTSPRSTARMLDQWKALGLAPRWQNFSLVFDERNSRPNLDALRIALESGQEQLCYTLWAALTNSFDSSHVTPAVRELFREVSTDHLSRPGVASRVVRGLAMMEHEGWKDAAQAAWGVSSQMGKVELVTMIGGLYEPSLVPILLEAQSSTVKKVSEAADTALERYARIRDARESWQTWERQGRDGSPVDALIAKTASDKKENVRIAAIKSLAALGATEALPFLVELLEDSDLEVAAAAQQALDRIHAASVEEESGG